MPAVLLASVLAIRSAEAYPPLRALRPAILSVAVSVIALWLTTSSAAFSAALRRPEVRWVGLYFGAQVLTIPFGLSTTTSLGIFDLLPFSFLLVLVFLLCRPDRKTLDLVIGWTIAAAVFTGLLILRIGIVDYDVVGGFRLGTLGMYDPNDLAALLALMIQLAIGGAMRGRGKWRLLAVGAAIAMFVILLKTGSRGAIVGIAAGTLVLLAGLRPQRLVMMLVALIIALPLAWKFGPETFRVRARTLFSLEEDYNFTSNSGRKEIWKRGIGYFAERPLMGVGVLNYRVREGGGNAAKMIAGTQMTAHNTYVQILVELGLVGLIPFLGLYWLMVRNVTPLWRRPTPSDPGRLYMPEILAAFTCFMVTATFLSHAYNYVLFFLIGLCALADRVAKADAAQRQQQGALAAAPRGAARRRGGGW
jgi:hypothetical protein